MPGLSRSSAETPKQSASSFERDYCCNIAITLIDPVVGVIACFRQLRSWKLLKIDFTLPRRSGVRISRGAPFLQVVQRAISDNQPLLMRHNGRVVVGDQSPAPMLLYPHSGKARVVGNCLAFILPIHC